MRYTRYPHYLVVAGWPGDRFTGRVCAVVSTLIVGFLAFVILVVRFSKTDMSVEITWKSIKIQRGKLDPPTIKPQPRHRPRNVDKPDPGADPLARSG
jgi:hypothetical protein